MLLTARRRKAPLDLETPRLRLVAITDHLLTAEATGLTALRRAVGAKPAADWPPAYWEPHVQAHILAQFTSHPHSVGWHRYMCLRGGSKQMVGCLGAFPCAAGDVEIGYSVVRSAQRQGFGTEAANAFVEWLLVQPAIHSVSAQTYESMPESVKVMQRCGMHFVGAGDEAGTVRYRRWR